MKLLQWILTLAILALGLSSASAQPAGETGDKEEDTLYYRRLVKVKNGSDEKVTVSLQYRTFAADQGKWVWLPQGAPQLGVAETYVIDPGQELDLTSLGVPVTASRIRLFAESDNLRWTTHRDLDLWIVPEVEDGEHRYKAGAMEVFTYFLMGLEAPPLLDEKGEPATPAGVVEQPRNSKFEFGQQKVIVLRPDVEQNNVTPFIPEKLAVLGPLPPILVPPLEPGIVLVREADLGVVDFRVDPITSAFSATVENFGPQTFRGGRRWTLLRSRGPAGFETVLQGWVSPMTNGGRFRVFGDLTGLGQGHRFIFALSGGDANAVNDATGLSLLPPLRADLAITDLKLTGNTVAVEVTNLGPGDYRGLSRTVTIADQQRSMTTTQSQPVEALAQGQTTILTFRVRPNTAANNAIMARLNLGDPNISNDFRDLRLDQSVPIDRLSDIRADRIELDGRTLRGVVSCNKDGVGGGFRQILLSFETLGDFPRRNLATAALTPLTAGATQEITLKLPFDPAKTSFRASLSIQPGGVDGDPRNDSKTRFFAVGPAPANSFDLAVGNITMFGNNVVASVSNVGTDPFPGVGTWSLESVNGKTVLNTLAKGTINALNPTQTLPISAPVVIPPGATHLKLSVAVADLNPNNNSGFIPVTAAAAQLAIANLRQSGSQLLWSFDKTPATGTLQGQWSYELTVNATRIANNPQVSPGPVAINLDTNTGTATLKLFNRLGFQRQLVDTKSLTLGGGTVGGIGGLTASNLSQNGKTITWNFDLTPPGSKLVGAWSFDVLVDNNPIATSKPAAAGPATIDLPVSTGGGALPTGTLTLQVFNNFGLGNTRTLKDTKTLQLKGGAPGLGSLTVLNPTIAGNKLTWTFGVTPAGATLSSGWVFGMNQGSPITPATEPLDGVGGDVTTAMIGPVQQLTIDPSKGNQVQVRIMRFGKGKNPIVDQAFPTPPLSVGGGADVKVVVNDARFEGTTLKWTFTVSPAGSTLPPGVTRTFSLMQAGNVIPGTGGPIDPLVGKLQQFVVDPTKGNGFQVRVEESTAKSGRRSTFPTIPLSVVGGGADVKVVVNDAHFEGTTLKWTFTASPAGSALPAGVTRTFTLLQAGNPIPGAGGAIDPLLGKLQQFVVDPAKGNGFQIRVQESGAKSLRNAVFPTTPLTVAAVAPTESDLAVTQVQLDPKTQLLTYTIVNSGPADYTGGRSHSVSGPFGLNNRGAIPAIKKNASLPLSVDLSANFRATPPNQQFSATVQLVAVATDKNSANDKATSNVLTTGGGVVKKGTLDIGTITYNAPLLTVSVINNTGDDYPSRFVGGLTQNCPIKVRILENGKEREVSLGGTLALIDPASNLLVGSIPKGATRVTRATNVGNLAPGTMIRVEINGPGVSSSKDQTIR